MKEAKTTISTGSNRELNGAQPDRIDMPEGSAARPRGEASGRRWARDQAQRAELDQLRYMYEQQGLGPASVEMRRWPRCLKIADEIGSTIASKWQTLWGEDWRRHEDRFWRAGFVDGALDVREGRDGLGSLST